MSPEFYLEWFFARALLNASAAESPVAAKIFNVTMTFRILCFTAFWRQLVGALLRPWCMRMKALVFYAAQLKGIKEDALHHDVEQKIDISRFDDEPAGDFSAARRYLQEKAQ